MLGDRPAILAIQPGQHPQHQRCGVPQRLLTSQPRLDAVQHRAERLMPPDRIYAMSRGHRGLLIVPHKQSMLARWPPKTGQKHPKQSRSTPQVTIYGCNTSPSPARSPRQAQRRFTTAEAAEIAERYQSGQTMNQLARSYGVHRCTIAHCLQKQQVQQRQSGLSPADVPAAAALYQSGWSLARIGERYGITDMTVRRALAKHGVEIRPRRGWH